MWFVTLKWQFLVVFQKGLVLYMVLMHVNNKNIFVNGRQQDGR